MASQKTSHLERTAAEPRGNDLIETKLSHIDQVNERVRVLRLDLNSRPVSFLPGQWLDTYVPSHDKAGGFTITSPPSAASAGPSPYMELAVQHSPDNDAALYLWRPAQDILGSTVKVRVGGSFVFPPAPAPAPAAGPAGLERLVLLAGGVGVNPLMCMLSYIAERRREEDLGHLQVDLAYASKVPGKGFGSILFLDRIARLYGEGSVKGSFEVFATGPNAESLAESETRSIHGAEIQVRRRRLSLEDVGCLVGKGEKGSTMIYMCGPQAMTDEFVTYMTSKEHLGLDPQRVMVERWW